MDVPRDVENALLVDALQRGPVTLVLRGTSMTPCIPSGSRVVLRPLAANAHVEQGSVVAFLRAGELVVHRVLRLREGQVRTQGDSLHTADAWITRTQLLAEATSAQWRDRTVALSPRDGALWRAGGMLFRRYYGLRTWLRALV